MLIYSLSLSSVFVLHQLLRDRSDSSAPKGSTMFTSWSTVWKHVYIYIYFSKCGTIPSNWTYWIWSHSECAFWFFCITATFNVRSGRSNFCLLWFASYLMLLRSTQLCVTLRHRLAIMILHRQAHNTHLPLWICSNLFCLITIITDSFFLSFCLTSSSCFSTVSSPPSQTSHTLSSFISLLPHPAAFLSLLMWWFHWITGRGSLSAA